MKWSWKITRLAGIDVYVHATFFILIAWINLSYWTVTGKRDGKLKSCTIFSEGDCVAAPPPLVFF